MRFFLHLAALLVLGTSSVLAIPQGNSDCAKWCQDNWSKAECGYKNQGACVSDKCTCKCDPGMSYCSSTKKCCDFQKDNNNCGKCDYKCNSGQTCKGGKCEPDMPVKCPDGKEKCNGACPDYYNDKNNCGSCGKKCNSGETCKGGKCEPDTPVKCPDGKEKCDGACPDYYNDKNNCGSCGKKCNSGETCKGGKCEPDTPVKCPDGTEKCDGACPDYHNDKNNCGTCGKKCNSGETCKSGKCEPDKPAPCPVAGEVMCDKGKNKDKCCKPEDCKA